MTPYLRFRIKATWLRLQYADWSSPFAFDPLDFVLEFVVPLVLLFTAAVLSVAVWLRAGHSEDCERSLERRTAWFAPRDVYWSST